MGKILALISESYMVVPITSECNEFKISGFTDKWEIGRMGRLESEKSLKGGRFYLCRQSRRMFRVLV